MKPSELKAGDVLVKEYDTYTLFGDWSNEEGLGFRAEHKTQLTPVSELCPGNAMVNSRTTDIYFKPGRSLEQMGFVAVCRDGNLIWSGRKGAE